MLYLLPNLLDENADPNLFLPQSIKDVVEKLDGIIAESEKGARQFLKRFTSRFREIPILLLNEHTDDLEPLLIPLKKGEQWGLISDAGLPILADPGAILVRHLHDLEIAVTTFPGPSSIIYALQLSGFSAQRFTFYGYPPKDEKKLEELLRTLPKNHTHIFIEAPYRTDAFLKKLVSSLQGETDLSVAWNLTTPSQGVRTSSIREWKKGLPTLGKIPAVFVISR